MDIKGFFMNIERKKLYEKLELFIETKYRQSLLEKLSKHYRIEKSAIKIEKKK